MLDPMLIDYLKSGKAWVLVGSGPSIERGYPTWEKLAQHALYLVKTESHVTNLTEINDAFKRKDYPAVFEHAIQILGSQRVIQYLNANLVPSRTEKKIYELIAQWPVPVYLTTNFDDEIQHGLAAINESYVPYTNSEDHLSYLTPDISGAIFKLHGDLRSDGGLILTSSQYKFIKDSPDWEYWRTKMTSVFQMSRMIIIGHSLTDPHLLHVLNAAKAGAGVIQPICWIAPDAKDYERKEFLDKYKIRVISYDNRDGEHQNLLRLLESVSDFVPKRTSISIKEQISNLINVPIDNNAAAPGFFVFNRLMAETDFDEKRIQAVLAALQSVVPQLKDAGIFNLQEALAFAGWPDTAILPKDFSDQICHRAVEQGLLFPVGNKFEINPKAEAMVKEQRNNFEHQKERFIGSLVLKIRNKFPALDMQNSMSIAKDIESSLTIYFRVGGLSLATTLFSTGKTNHNVLPSSIIKFIQEASSRYSDSLMRQAFFSISVDAFARSSPAEREYLGRIAQGFFAFHALGVFGDAAGERLRDTKGTVWLVDSSAQIPALALASSTCLIFRDCFSRLNSMRVRLFSTQSLFFETKEHLWFANNTIRDNLSKPYNIIAAARGEPPYKKSNVFLEGFINWQAAGNPNDWNSYMYQIFGMSNPDENSIISALANLGIEVIALKDWPGYSVVDSSMATSYVTKIVSAITQTLSTTRDFDQMADPREKASPEAEAMVIVRNERDGRYYMLSTPNEHSPSWFISDTSMLNVVEPGNRVTWQTDSFLKFASTIFPTSNPQTADNVFEILLLEFAQSGLSLLDDKLVEGVFGGSIDQATIGMREQRQLYEDTIGRKYGETIDDVMNRVPALYRPLVAVQLSTEMAQVALGKQKVADEKREAEAKRADLAEKELQKVDKYRKKVKEQQLKKSRKRRQNKSRPKK